MSVINNRYEILGTLSKDNLKSVFFAGDLEHPATDKVLLNCFSDTDIIYQLNRCSKNNSIFKISNVIDSFSCDSYFYIVCNDKLKGTSFYEYFKNDTTRLADRLRISQSLLIKLADLSDLSPMILYGVLSPDNILISANYNISLGNRFDIDKNIDYIPLIGNLLEIIFDGSESQGFKTAPPIIYEIIGKCRSSAFKNIDEILKELQGSLIFQTVLGHISVDSSLNTNIPKIQSRSKRGAKLPVLIPAVILVVFVAGGIWAFSNRDKILPKNEVTAMTPPDSGNTLPLADFEISPNIFYTNEIISFTDTSKDEDVMDTITQWKWTLASGSTIAQFFEKDFIYIFSEPNVYTLSLAVTDSNGNVSEECVKVLEVTEKPILPEPDKNSQVKDKSPK